MALLRLGIVHRSRLFRDCLATVLTSQGGFAISNIDLMALDFTLELPANDVDLWLIDLSLPDDLAITMTRRLKRTLPASRIIALASGDSDESIVDCIAAGADGCVAENAPIAELQSAIFCVTDGQAFCSHDIVHCMFRQLREQDEEPQWRERARTAGLTSREREILELVASHQSNKQIAKHLGVSLYTVKNHVHNILDKLKVQSRFEAADFARERHWLK